MNDRELLELAAKAVNAGCWHPLTHDPIHGGAWNPLADDGDALRLAVKLSMQVAMDHHSYLNDESIAHVVGHMPAYEPHGPDPCAATRRAIVRAAAEIGKVMP